jgi:hypothetical protein
MTHVDVGTTTALDVIANILRTNASIEEITTVVYVESENWVDRIGNVELSSSAVKAAMRQDPSPRRFTEISRHAALEGGLLKIQDRLGPNELLGITSRVRTKEGKQAQMPMMDFRCPVAEQNLNALAELLPVAGQKHGFILQSGRSYHYYGNDLLFGDRLWVEFLGKCLLMKNFVDERYVGHQLVDGHCVLRVSSSSQKPLVPILVRHF